MRYLLLLLCLNSCAFAQAKKQDLPEFRKLSPVSQIANAESAPPKTKVKFICTCNDDVGAKFATALRDLLAASPRYMETDDDNDKIFPNVKQRFVWVLSIVSVDASPGNPGSATAMSTVLLGGPIFLKQQEYLCGTNNVKHCAEDTFSYLDSTAANWK